MSLRKTLPSIVRFSSCLVALAIVFNYPAPAKASSPTTPSVTPPAGLDCAAWGKAGHTDFNAFSIGACTQERGMISVASFQARAEQQKLEPICKAAGYNLYADAFFVDYPFVEFNCSAGPDPFVMPPNNNPCGQSGLCQP